LLSLFTIKFPFNEKLKLFTLEIGLLTWLCLVKKTHTTGFLTIRKGGLKVLLFLYRVFSNSYVYYSSFKPFFRCTIV